MCLMQIIADFCGQSQGSSGKTIAITQIGQRRGLIGGNPPHFPCCPKKKLQAALFYYRIQKYIEQKFVFSIT